MGNGGPKQAHALHLHMAWFGVGHDSISASILWYRMGGAKQSARQKSGVDTLWVYPTRVMTFCRVETYT